MDQIALSTEWGEAGLELSRQSLGSESFHFYLRSPFRSAVVDGSHPHADGLSVCRSQSVCSPHHHHTCFLRFFSLCFLFSHDDGLFCCIILLLLFSSSPPAAPSFTYCLLLIIPVALVYVLWMLSGVQTSASLFSPHSVLLWFVSITSSSFER